MNSGIVRVDFSFGSVHHDSNEELAVTLFAHRAPKLVQFVLYFTEWEESLLFGTVFTSPVTTERAHSHFLFVFKFVLAGKTVRLCIESFLGFLSKENRILWIKVEFVVTDLKLSLRLDLL